MLREDMGYNVKVKKLVVKGLYGRYNYDVHFNEELTFLLGANGSGKTTILDMLSSIITGELYRLNNYEFDTIELNYLNKEDKQDAPNTIIITSTDDGDMELNFNDEHHKLYYLEHDSDVSHRLKRIKYFREYPVLEEIRGLFPFIYLPLNRKSGRNIPLFGRKAQRRDAYSYAEHNERYIYDVDDALHEAQLIISRAWQGVSQIKQKLDREFGLTEKLHESIALEEKT